jgi:hypothetical protein
MNKLVPDDLDCDELVELVTDYLEQELSVDERTRFEHHLGWCPPCTVYLRQVRDTVRVTGKLATSKIVPATRGALLDAFRSWKRSGSLGGGSGA